MELVTIVGLGILATALVALYIAAQRAVTIAELRVERGSVRVVRGGIVPPVLADLRDVAKRPPIDDLRILITRSSGRAQVTFSGRISEEQAQRVRNVVGRVPLARLVNAHKRR